MLVPEYLAAPNSTDATRVLILGECSLAVALANAFETSGAFVSMIGESGKVDDLEVLRAAVEQFRPHFVVPASDEVSIATLQQLQAAVDVEIVPSSSFLERAYDREHIYQIAADELGLPTPLHGCASNVNDALQIAAAIGYPCVARSVENTGETASYILQDDAAVTAAWEKLQAPRIILERLVDYDYAMTILAVRSIDPQTGKLATWFCQPIGKVLEHGQLAGAFQPLILEQAALDNAHSMVARITNAIGGRGIFAVDLFVAGEDVYFSGLSAHPNHSGTVTRVTQRISQAELLARAVLGLPIDVTLVSPGAVRFIELGRKKLQHSQITQALSIPETQVFFTRNGYCALAATADTAVEAYQRATQAFSAVESSDTAQAAELAVMPSGPAASAPEVAAEHAAGEPGVQAEQVAAESAPSVEAEPAAGMESVVEAEELTQAPAAEVAEVTALDPDVAELDVAAADVLDADLDAADDADVAAPSDASSHASSDAPGDASNERAAAPTTTALPALDDEVPEGQQELASELVKAPGEEAALDEAVAPEEVTDVVTPPADPGDIPDESLNNVQRP